MKITFELEPSDLRRFHEALARARRMVRSADECDIVAAARHALQSLPIGSAPCYMRKRMAEVQRLIVILEDDEFALPQAEREEVARTLVYFSDPEDMIPDDVPVIGLLDDAIMLELLLRRLRHVLQAYDDFEAFRHALPVRAGTDARLERARLVAKRRDALHARMRRRAAREDTIKTAAARTRRSTRRQGSAHA
ncbi:MAG TPA: YkvA family protein [Xanthomonadales bacterium]|nr:YkvA family protein [Xanthomonadales bacterium]